MDQSSNFDEKLGQQETQSMDQCPHNFHEDEEFLACARAVAEAYWERVDGIMDRYERCHDDCLSNGPKEGISPIGNPGGER